MGWTNKLGKQVCTVGIHSWGRDTDEILKDEYRRAVSAGDGGAARVVGIVNFGKEIDNGCEQ